MKVILYSIIFSLSIFILACESDDFSDEASMGYETDEDSTINPEYKTSLDAVETIDKNGSQIYAAEWNDLNNWSFWQSLMNDYEYNQYALNWRLYLQERYKLLVTDIDGNPIPNARVSLLENAHLTLWQSQTDNHGTAELWNGLTNNHGAVNFILIETKDSSYYLPKPFLYEENINSIRLNTQNAYAFGADIMFVVDATGSMEEEITYLQDNLLNIAASNITSNRSDSLRFGAVFYRDRGEEYLLRNFDLNHDIEYLYSNLKQQEANGGGDTPEAVIEALEQAIFHSDWNENAKARLLFLLLDAPPHFSPLNIDKLHFLLSEAAQKGIKIIPIGAQGISLETEFLMRMIAMSTNGTYIFLTPDHSSTSDDYRKTKGDYQIEPLHSLISKIIYHYIE